MFKSTSNSVFLVVLCALVISSIGIYFYTLGLKEIVTVLIFYFLYFGVGVSMMLHRFYSHKSFTFKSVIVQKLCTIITVLAGRGSPMGWVYVHRVHHAYSDTDKDPHPPNSPMMLLPHRTKVEKINLRLIKDLLNKENIFINDWYVLIHIVFVLALTLINPWLTVFVWAIPVCITGSMMDVVTYCNHFIGYRNFETKDNSRNIFILGYLALGEGWHNNHHANASNYSFQHKWWEFDPIALIIKIL